ncbi:ornithine cyclodeaminase [Rhizobium leguminosarum]|uniref:cyclodeaminase n=1 Tax=Rhizobium leguminosarum TaxID=384 RepID=UPI00160D2734|nr:cyclodeaminase [Rhizobium leguminosarum]MBB4388502.1 ornithine cyclodeaminase [Rhizobium leguminosarum]
MVDASILTEHQLRQIVRLDLEALKCVEDAFVALATKSVVMPPIMRIDVPEHRGEVDVKSAYIPGAESFAIKISPGYFDNPKLGLPSTSGLMILLDSKTGLLKGLLLDNGYLTEVRTAAAGALAAKCLAATNASIAAVLGAGVQAKLQLQALALVRPIRQARIWARNHEKAEKVARELSEELQLSIVAHEDPQRAIAGSHVIVTTTPATRPILKEEWLEPGQHVTAMGSDAEHKNEIDPGALEKADLYVADSLKQTRRLGELRHALAIGIVENEEKFVELGDILAGLKTGRTNESQITVADLTGTGIQDTAIATFAYSLARAAAMGTTVKI